MNNIRCLCLGVMIVISSSMLAFGGEMQAPGKSDPAPAPTPAVSASTTDGTTQPTSAEEIQLVWQDASTMLVKILLTIF